MRLTFLITLSFIIPSLYLDTAAATEEEKYICMYSSDANISALNKDNEGRLCDFQNSAFFHPNMRSSTSEFICKAIAKEPFKLEIYEDKIRLFNGAILVYFERHDHQDGITGIGVSDGQYQKLLTFAPKTNKLSYSSINPYLGVSSTILICYN